MPLQVFYFCMRLASASKIFFSAPLIYEKLKSASVSLLGLGSKRQQFIHLFSFKKRKDNQMQEICENLRTYSGAPVWIPSLRSGELGSIEPHQRGEGLRHPVGDHRHGAEHDADLQQRHRHLCAFGLFPPLSLLHSTDSGEKQGRRVMLPRAACCFTRESGSVGLFLDISKRSTGGERVGRKTVDRNGESRGQRWR